MASGSVIMEELKTTVTFEEFRTKWDARAEQPEQFLKSEPFGIAGWVLEVKLKSESEGYAGLYLERHRDNCHLLHVDKFEVDCRQTKRFDRRRVFAPAWITGHDHAASSGWGWKEFDTESNLLAHADSNGGALVMRIVIQVVRPSVWVDPSSCLRLSPKDLLPIVSTADAITIKGEEDCEVKVPAGFIKAHSSVLAAALESGMEEDTSRVVTMPGVQKQTIEDLRDCLIGGGLPPTIVDSQQRISDLLVLADKYAIAPLAEACTVYLSMAISIATSSSLLLTSDRYGLLALRKAVMRFVMESAQHFDAVLNSDEYDAFSADLLREFWAYATVRKAQSVSNVCVPLNGQWGTGPHEFTNKTEWQKLSKDSLRRACFERLLGTSGTAAELLFRLGNTDSHVEEPEAKRQRTSD